MDVKLLSESAQKKVMSYNWPGNVRELKSVIQLSVVMSSGNVIEESDISLVGKDVLPDIAPEEMTLRAYNRRIVSLYLDKYNHDTALVAKKLGIGQTTVYRLINEMKLKE
jgi:two-component system response regulator AtoC